MIDWHIRNVVRKTYTGNIQLDALRLSTVDQLTEIFEFGIAVGAIELPAILECDTWNFLLVRYRDTVERIAELSPDREGWLKRVPSCEQITAAMT
ncbi:hypothetical protein [Aeoliella sp. SH292]|uniref:hypothetical protein n=1 Tax=Aeoliella sp. SH292 TaxID=3454464 RepID=UPI003F95D07C